MSQTLPPPDGLARTEVGKPVITLDKVNKWYGALHVLRDVSLTIQEGERVVVCGPSGSGKSTMIRCINRLETHQDGHIFVDGTELTDDTRALDTIRREVGMVFQSFNLFPHLTHPGELHARADLGPARCPRPRPRNWPWITCGG